ncbi:MAG: hypothetical protein IPJ88_17120 [Myxococcales bacterium]|nr:MAG: hypothetical protein IPJ88_17120 [Myxococcales bacterium]
MAIPQNCRPIVFDSPCYDIEDETECTATMACETESGYACPDGQTCPPESPLPAQDSGSAPTGSGTVEPGGFGIVCVPAEPILVGECEILETRRGLRRCRMCAHLQTSAARSVSGHPRRNGAVPRSRTPDLSGVRNANAAH